MYLESLTVDGVEMQFPPYPLPDTFCPTMMSAVIDAIHHTSALVCALLQNLAYHIPVQPPCLLLLLENASLTSGCLEFPQHPLIASPVPSHCVLLRWGKKIYECGVRVRPCGGEFLRGHACIPLSIPQSLLCWLFFSPTPLAFLHLANLMSTLPLSFHPILLHQKILLLLL